MAVWWGCISRRGRGRGKEGSSDKQLLSGFEFVTRGFELITRGFQLVTCKVELVTREFELVDLNW